MTDDYGLPVPAPELPGQLAFDVDDRPGFAYGITRCDEPGCAWSAAYGAALNVPDGDLAVVYLCATHFPTVDGDAVRAWPIA